MLSPPRPRSPRWSWRGGAGVEVASGPARPVLLLGALTALLAVAFVFAPVHQPEVRYTWTPAAGDVALPLMPYQPTELTATLTCAAARRGAQLATVPPHPDPAAAPLAGLIVLGVPGGVTVTSAGVALGTVALPPGDCTLTLHSDAIATTVTVDGAPALTHPGDVRPDVAGIFAAVVPGTPADGVALALTADTRFATTPTAVKLALAVACLVAAGALGALLARADRAARTSRVRLLPPGWWRPRPVDGVVAAVLALWWVVGAGTVDDGYIAGIVRGRGESGFVGNVYRWLNAPEAPFGWFYEVDRWWSLASPAGVPTTPWLRLPSTLLGLLCWALVSRLLLPRLGRAARRPATPWVAALAFTTWWVPFGLGLRPEPWVAVGVVLVVLGVERTLATRRVLPLAVSLAAAGATTAVTPGGLMAFAPVLAAAVPLLRLLRGRTDLQLRGSGRALPLLAVLVAAPVTALLLMAADQGAAALAEAVRVRGLIGGGRPWAEESVRYALLVTPGAIQGAIGRRAAVLPTLLAAAGLVWTLTGRLGPRVGIAPGPARRLLGTLALAAVAMTFTPTKWTQHFGDLAGLGTAVLTLGLVAFGRRAQRAVVARDPGTARRRWVVGLAGATAVGALVLAGQNLWPFVSGWYTPTFSTLPPQVTLPVGDVPLATILILAGALALVGPLARSVWWRSADRPGRVPTSETGPGPLGDPGRDIRAPFRTDSRTGSYGLAGGGPSASAAPPAGTPVAVLVVVLVAVLALQVLGLARIAVAHPDGYTPTADAVAAAAGDPCGLQSALLVETDPAAGTLAPAGPAQPGPPPPGPRPATLDVGGTAVPGIAVTAPGTTPWYALDGRQRAGALPVVVTVTGWTRPTGELAAEFARGTQVLAHVPLAGSVIPADRRVLAPPDADAVRLTVAARVAAGPALDGPTQDGATPDGTAATGAPDAPLASLPRAPVLTPMTRVLPRGTGAVLDWPVAFVFPCLAPAPLPPGTAALPRFRVGPPSDDPSADITYTPGLGGPFAGPRLLVTQHRMPTYVRGDPLREGPQLYRWDPLTPLGTLTPTTRTTTVVSPFAATHLRVPRLDQQE